MKASKALLSITALLAACSDRVPTAPQTVGTAALDLPLGQVFVGAGNIASCSALAFARAEATAKLLDAIPGTVFAAGDNAFPNGTAVDYANCYDPTWGRHKARTYAALGNHEYDAGSATGAFDYFGDRAGPRGLGYYSFDLGDWHIVVLNDNIGFVSVSAGSAQDQWLQADLAATTKQCVLAVWHTPLFLSTNTAGYTQNPSRKQLWNRLYAAGADVVINGGQHHYERMAPLRPDGTPDTLFGIRQFNVGTGGESIALPTVAIHPSSEVRSATYGVLKLVLGPGTYTWEFVPVPGSSFSEQGIGLCHGPPGSPPVQPPPPPPPPPILGHVLAGAGNIASCGSPAFGRAQATAQLLDAIGGTVFTVGDNAFPSGSATDYANCYEPTWGRHKARTRPALGNNDYGTGTADATFNYFGVNAGPPGLGYYSYDAGDWHVIVLNDQVAYSAGSAQDQWLQADLAATTKQCTLAMWHTPLFLSTNTAGYTVNPSRKQLWDRLHAAGVDVVINGNQFHYERMAPMRPDGTPDALGGMRQFNVGTGGASIALPTVAIHPSSEVRSATYGVLKLTLNALSYTWEFVPMAGQSFTDVGAGVCH